MMMLGDGGGGENYSGNNRTDVIEFAHPFTISKDDDENDEYLVVISEPAVFDRVRCILRLLVSKKAYQFPFDAEVCEDGIVTKTPVAWLDWEQGKTVRWFIPEVEPEPPPKPFNDFDFGEDDGDGDVRVR
jgi:hypothetical protein